MRYIWEECGKKMRDAERPVLRILMRPSLISRSMCGGYGRVCNNIWLIRLIYVCVS